MPLTGSAARTLRALAHRLKPVVQVGKEGATKRVVSAVARALHDHELIKVKLMLEDSIERRITAARLASQTASEVADIVGRIVVLYRPHPRKPTIKIPAGYTAPRLVSLGAEHDSEE